MTFDTALAGSGIVAASVSGDAGRAIFAGCRKKLEAVQKDLDSGNPHVAGFAIPNVTVTVKAAVQRETQTGRNVVAYLPATSPTTGVDKPWVALGAHYDHLGRGGHGNSLARQGRSRPDSSSARTTMRRARAAALAIAEALAKQPRRRNVMVGSGRREEIGLIGSNAFVNKPPVPIDRARRISQLRHGRPHGGQQAHRSGDRHESRVGADSRAGERRRRLRAGPAAGSVPADRRCQLQSGERAVELLYEHPHRLPPAGDTADKINYEDLDRVVDFAAAIVKRARRHAGSAAVHQGRAADEYRRGRAGIRVFTGTIPDYATNLKGLLLGGVVGGGPAEKAGLQKGDVIVEIAGQTIANIYDYTYALELLKIGEPVKIVYMRGGKRSRTSTHSRRARKIECVHCLALYVRASRWARRQLSGWAPAGMAVVGRPAPRHFSTGR